MEDADDAGEMAMIMQLPMPTLKKTIPCMLMITMIMMIMIRMKRMDNDHGDIHLKAADAVRAGRRDSRAGWRNGEGSWRGKYWGVILKTRK